MGERVPKPVFVVPSKSADAAYESAEALIRLPKDHSIFKEKFLQKLLAEQPEILPVHSIRSDVGKLLCIGREVKISGDSIIDNLYLSTNGYPVVVETKLWRNPEARRTVFAQTLEYLKEIVSKDFEWLAEQRLSYCRQFGLPTLDLATRLNELSGNTLEQDFIVDRTNRALHAGDVIAMIVGDGIETGLQKLVAHYCKDSAHFRYSLALVELACYQFAGRIDEGILIVPRIVQEVEPVQRAYVRVELVGGREGQLKVTPVVENDSPTKTNRRINLNEADFLHSVEESAGADVRATLEGFYNDVIDSFGLEPEFKAATLTLKLMHPADNRPGASVLAFGKQGTVYNPDHLKRQLTNWGIKPETVDQIATGYWNDLHQVDPGFSPKGITHVAPRLFIPIGGVAGKLNDIKCQVGRVVEKIQEETGRVVS